MADTLTRTAPKRLSQMGLHPTDPYPQGFTVADTWMQEFSLLAG